MSKTIIAQLYLYEKNPIIIYDDYMIDNYVPEGDKIKFILDTLNGNKDKFILLSTDEYKHIINVRQIKHIDIVKK